MLCYAKRVVGSALHEQRAQQLIQRLAVLHIKAEMHMEVK